MASRFHRNLQVAVVLALFLPSSGRAQIAMPMCHSADSASPTPPSQLPVPQHLAGIGNVHFPITANAEAQAWFEQGMNLLFDFWDYEADRAFEQSIRADPACAMCYWGLYQSESFRNGETNSYARQALDKAVLLAPHATSREKLYIQAARMHEAPIPPAGSKDKKDKAEFTREVATLRKLVRKNPHDTNARIFLADAVKDGYDSNGQPRAGEKEARELLAGVLRDEPDNSAANHLWIHAVEPSLHPEDALHSAEILGSLAPASGHMVHMPGHIFYRLGDYERAQTAFDASTQVDESYIRQQHVAIDNDWNYVHNLMYSVANLLEEGHMEGAEQVSAKLSGARGHREDTLYPWSARDAISRVNPALPVALRTADWARVIVLVDAANLPSSMPNMDFLAGGLAEFALGMQAAEAREPDVAERHSALLDANLWRMSQEIKAGEAVKIAAEASAQGASRSVPGDHAMQSDPLAKPLVQTLSIMSLELRATILATQNQLPQAIKLFVDARQQEKDLGYHEPPFYIRPVSECEAAAFMAAGKWSEAETAYRQALIERPRSGFALYGIALAKENSGDTAQATAAYQQFAEAWKTADESLPQVKHARQWLAGHGSNAMLR
jgi:tetratricopeptide (TPR) repeat protein